MTRYAYDLVAIGGGTAGLVSAAGAQYLGARAGLIEKHALGGDCLWTGCVPSKALIASARLAEGARQAERLGVTAEVGDPSMPKVMARMRRVRDRVAHHDDPERFRALGVGVHFGAARFTSPDEIEVEGVGRIRSPRFVLATGAEVWVPPIPGLEQAGYLTHVTALERDDLPPSILVLGGGPIGLEFAQLYRRLGAEVTVLEVAERILLDDDPDVAAFMTERLEEEGIGLAVRTSVTRVEVEGGQKTLVTEEGARHTASEIFVATGRRPMLRDLGLEVAGIEILSGAVRVDDRLRTTNRRVWACGDVLGGMQFTHVADYAAKLALRNALLPGGGRVDYGAVPRVTFTDPEVAHVGLSEEEADAKGATTFRYDLRELDRAICDGTANGFVKVSASKRGRVLGATIVAHGAGEMLMPLVIALKHDLTLVDLSNTIFPYPTMNEGVLRTAQEFRRSQLDSLGGRLLKRVVGWLA